MPLVSSPPDWDSLQNSDSMGPRDWLRLIGGILMVAGLFAFAVGATGNIYAFLVGPPSDYFRLK